MRILQLGRFWKVDGGVQMHAQLLSRSLANQGIEIVNLVASRNLRPSDQIVDGYRLIESPSMGIRFATALCPTMPITARRMHAKKSFDIVHLHFPDPMSHLVSMSLPANLPRVITWHSDIVKQQKLLRAYRPWQYAETMRAKAIIAPTAAHFSSSRQIPHEYPSSQRHVIPFGMDYEKLASTPAVQATTEQIRTRAAGRFLVFALGRHVAYKGFDILLAAIQRTSAFLILGGEGPLQGELKAQAEKLGIGDRVWFTGRLADEEMAACYHACDIFCLSSITPNEAFGLVQLEAMACGKPVICTNLNNGVNTVNPHGVTGLTVPVNDPKALGEAIDKLAADSSLRCTLGKQAQHHARNTYSMATMGKRHILLYEQLLSTSS